MPKKILITGGTGLIGVELSELLRLQGHEVSILSRRKKSHPHFTYYTWDIDKNYIEEGALDVDVIIHLAGAGIADKRWTSERKKLIIDSRVESTKLIADKLRSRKEKLPIFIGASAIGIYGEKDDHALSEDEVNEDRSSFLVDVTHRWEDAHKELEDLVGQWSLVRIGIVLSTDGGALKSILIPFNFRMGNYFGDGSQIFSWIHITDLCRVFSFIIENELSGIYNGVAPDVVTGKQLVDAITESKKGPFLKFGVPEFALKLAFGEMSETVLMSTWASADKLLQDKFHFEFGEIQPAMQDLLSSK